MKLGYNVTGAARKSLAGAISSELNLPTRYLGMPTAAYEIGEYTIDKTGTVTGPDNLDLEDALHQQGFDAETREYDEPDTYESGLGGMGAVDYPDIDQHHPGQYADPNEPPTEEMLRHSETWMEGQPDFEDLELTEREELGLGRERREDCQGENGMQASDVPDFDDEDESCRLVIEMPLTGFTPEKLDNLAKLVNAKAPLLKAALGTDDLPIQQTADTLKFPWFGDGLDPDTIKAYSTLIGMLCATAKEKKRVTAKEKAVEGSPKYAMRCFLLSLGFIGDEYRVSRKILLSKLDGNSSWKHKQTYTTHCYIYPNGSEEDAMDATVEEFTSLAKAKAHVDTFAANTDGIYFAGAHVEDEKGNYVYELLCG